jgi:hypothetical protein
MTSSERDPFISMSRVDRLPDVGEDEFVTQGFFAKVMDSEAVGEKKRASYFDSCPAEQKVKMLDERAPIPQYVVRSIREWLRAVGVHADVWEWLISTEQEGWIRTPLSGVRTAEQYITAGWETRCVPIRSQTLPCIADSCFQGSKTVPETRTGWVDNYMCRQWANPNPARIYTFCQLED